MKIRVAALFSALMMIFAVSNLQAQGPAPTAYSIVEDPGFVIMGPSVVKVYRDGSKEVVDQVMPVAPGRDKEYHGHLVYDFQSHTLYTEVLSEPNSVCGAQTFNDPTIPPEFDPIAGSAALQKEMASPDDKYTTIGPESLNGIPTILKSVTSAQANGKIWFTRDGGYPVKILIVGKDGKETTMFAVKKLVFAKPPASVFALSASCQKAEVPAPPPVPSTNVTAVTLNKIGNVTGACPAHVRLTGTITVDGPGTVFYQFGAGSMEPGATVVFTAAGTKTVAHVITFEPKYGNNMGGGAILEAIGADAKGNHTQATMSSNADFNINCTSGGGK